MNLGDRISADHIGLVRRVLGSPDSWGIGQCALDRVIRRWSPPFRIRSCGPRYPARDGCFPENRNPQPGNGVMGIVGATIGSRRSTGPLAGRDVALDAGEEKHPAP